MMGAKGTMGMMCGLPGAQMMGKAGPMMGAKGTMGMMGGPQMMGMMGKAGPGMMTPQMMGVMGGKGPMVGMPGMGAMGCVRPMVPQMQAGLPQPSAMAGGPLTAAALAAAPAGVQKQMLGEKLFPAISRLQPELAGKITGMMLEMDNSELLMLLESDAQLRSKVEEAMRVIEGGRM